MAKAKNVPMTVAALERRVAKQARIIREQEAIIEKLSRDNENLSCNASICENEANEAKRVADERERLLQEREELLEVTQQDLYSARSAATYASNQIHELSTRLWRAQVDSQNSATLQLVAEAARIRLGSIQDTLRTTPGGLIVTDQKPGSPE